MGQPKTFDEIWEVLSFNQQWDAPCGPKNEAPLSKTEKGNLCGKITKDLNLSWKANGDEYFSELWPEIKRPLAVQNWFARKIDGTLWEPIALWRAIYRRASQKADKAMKSKPETVHTVMMHNLEELALQSSGAEEKFN